MVVVRQQSSLPACDAGNAGANPVDHPTFYALSYSRYRTVRCGSDGCGACTLFIIALVAQTDGALDYEPRGWRCESSRARHFLLYIMSHSITCFPRQILVRGRWLNWVPRESHFIGNLPAAIALARKLRAAHPEWTVRRFHCNVNVYKI